MHWLDHLKIRLFPPVTRSAALEIARQSLSQSASQASLICYGRKPASYNIYASLPEPCWWIVIPWNDGKEGFVIRSSRVIAVGRANGQGALRRFGRRRGVTTMNAWTFFYIYLAGAALVALRMGWHIGYRLTSMTGCFAMCALCSGTIRCSGP
ncbi:MAG: hypothetical protein IPJ52_01920 [Rhodocyclaceae bacterium]|nr:hypothetical protein [Rhodocyclaceae bacterium]